LERGEKSKIWIGLGEENVSVSYLFHVMLVVIGEEELTSRCNFSMSASSSKR